MVLDSLTQRARRRGQNPLFGDDSLIGWRFWDMRSVSGATVTDESALSLTAFYRGVKLIAETIAGLPVHVYERGSDGTSMPVEDALVGYLTRRPNDEMTRQTVWEHVIADEVRGNGYLWVDSNRNGQPAALWPIDRRRVRPGRTRDGQKVYEVEVPSGEPVVMVDFKMGGEMLHIPNWGVNGLMGFDPVKIAREAIALGLSAEEYAARFFSQDGTPAGVLTSDQPLTPDESDRIAERWQKRQAGTRNARRIAVLGHGAKFQPVSAEPEKAQMQQLRSFQGEEIARLLGIPPHMLGFTEKVTSWGSGIAEQARGFVVFTLQAHINRVEQAINDALLVRELTGRFVKLDTGGLLRGTTLQRYQAYALGYGRWLTPNDIRRDEDLPPIDGGDVLPAASNLVPIEDLGANFRQEQEGN